MLNFGLGTVPLTILDSDANKKRFTQLLCHVYVVCRTAPGHRYVCTINHVNSFRVYFIGETITQKTSTLYNMHFITVYAAFCYYYISNNYIIKLRAIRRKKNLKIISATFPYLSEGKQY